MEKVKQKHLKKIEKIQKTEGIKFENLEEFDLFFTSRVDQEEYQHKIKEDNIKAHESVQDIIASIVIIKDHLDELLNTVSIVRAVDIVIEECEKKGIYLDRTKMRKFL